MFGTALKAHPYSDRLAVVDDHLLAVGYRASPPMSYDQAVRFVNQTNVNSWMGQNDWRMPSISELYDLAELLIQKARDDSPVPLTALWSTTPHPHDQSFVLGFNGTEGIETLLSKVESRGHVVLVR
jgi:hypothetical protein